MEVRNLPSPPDDKTGWPWTRQTLLQRSTIFDCGSWPRISIVTPSYNQGKYIEETIRSVLMQGYPDLEYIIIDGNSSDNSVDLIKKYSTWIAHWVSEPDRGQSHAINKGFELARGEVFAWLNSDDVLAENSLTAVGRYFSEFPDCQFLAGYGEFRDVSGQSVVWRVTNLPRSLAELLEYPLGKYLAQPSVFFKRSAFQAAAKLNEQLHYSMDLDLWLRLADHYQLHIIPNTLSWMRIHDDAKTFRDNMQVFLEVERITANYKSRVSLTKYRMILRAARRARARACIRLAHNGPAPYARKQMARALVEASKHDRCAAFTRGGLGIVLRLVLPRFLWKLLFQS